MQNITYQGFEAVTYARSEAITIQLVARCTDIAHYRILTLAEAPRQNLVVILGWMYAEVRAMALRAYATLNPHDSPVLRLY